MTDKLRPHEMTEADLDHVTGAGSKHDRWIPVETMSQGAHSPAADSVPTESITLNYEEIKWSY